MTLLHARRESWKWAGCTQILAPTMDMQIWENAQKFHEPAVHSSGFSSLVTAAVTKTQNPAERGERGCPSSVTPAEVCRKIQNFEFKGWQVPIHLSGFSKNILFAGFYSVMRPALCLTDLELSRVGSAVSGAGITNWIEQNRRYSCRISRLR